MGIDEVFGAFGLRISCGPLELTSVREHDIDEISALIVRGIYDPREATPFLRRWAEEPPEQVPLSTMRFYWRLYADFTPAAWHLVLAVRENGRLVGVQDLTTKDFAKTRTVTTGSWLGRAHQGRGIGTLMRQTVCAFGFDELGATQMTSAYLVGNERSAAVSRKLGYRPNGLFRLADPDGEGFRLEQRVALSPDDFVRPPHPVEATGVEGFRRLIGLG